MTAPSARSPFLPRRPAVANVVNDEIGRFGRISIPLVRRIYPKLVAADIVGVQPLREPTALQFFLRYQYSSNSKSRPAVPVNWLTEGF